MAPKPAQPSDAPWEISDRGVGPIVLGAPLPESLRVPDLEARYFARYVGDFQPEEGFRFENPPVEITIRGGPFAQKAEVEAVEPDAQAHRAAAGKAARAGKAKVAGIRVLGEGPRTATGAGVGTSLTTLKSALEKPSVHAVPALLGGDECAATTPALAHVVFLLPSCKTEPESAKVVRVEVRVP